jgi:RNA polymerase sigma factor (sigma-70 family)
VAKRLTNRLSGCIRQVVSAVELCTEADQELLRRFVSRRDEAAFAAVVRRHGPMVLRVALRTIQNEHDAEDVLQATFLVLSQKAHTLRRQESLGSWLYGVAYRLALKTKALAGERRNREQRVAATPVATALAQITVQEAQAILDEELNRLPKKLREPVVLCCLEGLARDEAAQQIGCPASVLKSRLEQARERLRQRLVARGLTLPCGLGAFLLLEGAAGATVPSTLIGSTTKAAITVAAGQAVRTVVTAKVAALTEGALKTMLMSNLKAVIAIVLVLGFMSTGATVLTYRTAAAQEDKPPDLSDVRVQPEIRPDLSKTQFQPEVKTDHDGLPAGARFRFASLHLRHPGQINNSALSPDAKLLATSSGRSVMIWELHTGRALRRFSISESGGWSTPGLTFSPDGSLLAYLHGSEKAVVWNVATGKEALVLGAQLDQIRARGQFTRDGSQFVVADKNGIHAWNTKTGMRDRSEPAQYVNGFSPDAKIFVQNREIVPTTFGNAETGKEIRTLDIAVANNGIENGLAFSPDSNWLALVNIDKTVELRHTSNWEMHASFPLPKDAFRGERPDGSRYPQYRVALSPDAKVLFLGMGDGTLYRWDVAAKQELPPLKTQHREIANIHCTADKQTLFTTGHDGLVRRWHPMTGAVLAEPEGYVSPTHAALSPDGRLVIAGDVCGRLDLWDARTGKLIRALRKAGSPVRKLAFDSTNRTIAVAQEDGSIALWDVAAGPTGKPLALPKAKEENWRSLWVKTMQFSPDGRHLYVCPEYKPLRFELATGKMEQRGTSGDFALSSDGTMLATAYTARLTLWDETTGKMRLAASINGESDRLGHPIAMAFSPDRRLLAAGLRDGHIALMNAATSVERKRFIAVPERKYPRFFPQREPHHVTALKFSADGRWLIAGADDTRVRLWEVATGKKLAEFDGHDAEVADVAFTPDSRAVFSSAADGQSYLWDLRPAGLTKNSPDALWEALRSEDAESAYRAIWALAENPAAAAKFLQTAIAPAKGPDLAHQRKLVADLNSDDFGVRDAAQQELAKLADLAAAAIEEGLKKPPTLEVKRRLEGLQSALQGDPTPTKLREIRAVQALELAAAPETTAVLRLWAAGAAGADLSKNAQAALERIQRRAK